ncbi:peroxidasin homolog isoform X3 [Oscarella lobularis]|uniref:peroxidasin homolog isoform X3 n=1 Tax=Oscarella lobularis TaxID=121494 RepID=UPI0033142501
MSFAAVLCFAAFGSVVYWAASQPFIEVEVPGDQKYLVIGQSVESFLYCVAVDIPLTDVKLCLLTPVSFFQVDHNYYPRYRFHCEKTAKNVTCAYSNSDVNETDAGIYICSAVNCNNLLINSKIHISAYDKPLIDHIAESASNGTVQEGQSFHLTCVVNVPIGGTAGFSMEWRHNSKTVKSQRGLSNFVYNVQSATRSDSGHYFCAILNGTELDLSSTAIDITYPAQIVAFFARTPHKRLYPGKNGVVYVNTGGNVTIECTAEGNPVPVTSVHHSKDVRVIESKLEGQKITFLLNITRAEGKRDNGVYICQSHNSVNPIAMQKILNLFVYKTATITFFDLVNDSDTTNSAGCRNLTAGEQHTLECRADGEPPPVVTILDEGGEQVANALRNVSYSFSAKKELDEKAFECKAITSVLNSTANVTISFCVSSTSGLSLLDQLLIAFGGLVVVILISVALFYNFVQRLPCLPNTTTPTSRRAVTPPSGRPTEVTPLQSPEIEVPPGELRPDGSPSFPQSKEEKELWNRWKQAGDS